MPISDLLPTGFRLIELDSVASTNDEARTLAERGAADGTAVLAHTQTAGRARRGRQWVSETGNLFFSLILRPECPASDATQLGFAASVAIAEAAARHLPKGAEVRCKWPNDVLVGGRKLSGMLLEAGPAGSGGDLDWLILGIGINIVSHPEDTPFPATSLAGEGGEAVAPADLLAVFCRRFAHWRAVWRGEGFAPLRHAWLSRAAGLGDNIEVRLETTTLSGTFEELDGHGALVLLQENGRHVKITAGDVFLPSVRS